MNLQNYALGHWQPFEGVGIAQHDAFTGDVVALVGSGGLDYAAMFAYARKKGSPALRKMTFQERGRLLKALALYLNERKEKYYTLSYHTGATRSDSWIDIDGGIGVLFAYASLRRKLPDAPFLVDGDTANLSKGGTFIARHLLVPKLGVALHINAFNFPIWGMLEKLAATFLAGMPAIVKPSEVSSFLTEAVVRDLIASEILPPGALQLDCGNGIGILDPVQEQDVVTFTGSAATGQKLKVYPAVIAHSTPFNMEADSLNAAVLGEDAAPGTAIFDLFIKEVRREMTVKCGQKCTAIRRILVPESYYEAVQQALIKELAKTTIGDPRAEDVRMGPLVSKKQQAIVQQRLELLLQHTPKVFQADEPTIIGGNPDQGAFFSPVLLRNDQPFQHLDTHLIEAFGPIATVMPYRDMEEAIQLANLGKGALVSTIATADLRAAQTYVMESAPYHGRILILNEASAKESTGHGSPMPLLAHGGPGRAGGGEEMGGLRGLYHYLQRTAVQGHPSTITAISGVYEKGAAQIETPIHPFRKPFPELVIGETHVTHRHTVTETDIVNFANLTGDHFFAHVDETALAHTPFERRVAHGYWILSKAAGMFVEPRKGSVLLNYGLEECRFVKPVYPGMTIGVRLTVKEKILQEQKPEEADQKGIVKWLVDVYDETNETVAIATILTMVKC